MHIVATHSYEGGKVERTIEWWIFHPAEFIDFDIAKVLGKAAGKRRSGVGPEGFGSGVRRQVDGCGHLKENSVNNSKSRAFVIAIGLVCGTCATLAAEEIKVSPGAGAIGAALKKAKAGDVLKIEAGEYAESVEVPGDVAIEGAGADKTIITGPDYAVVRCGGPRVRIVGVGMKGGEKTVRGVNANGPVRIERCRFVGLPEAVAMAESPMSDVVACEFVDCRIGVRAIGGACPTVWGCVFKGGDMGVFAMDGSPYIRNNLFTGMKTGIRMMPHDIQQASIRNNVFVKCEQAAIAVLAGERLFLGPSIRNSVIVDCGAAIVGGEKQVAHFSHAVVQRVPEPVIRDDAGKKGAEAAARQVTTAEFELKVGDDFTVTMSKPELVEGKGVRLCSEEKTATGTIGLEKAWMRLGIGATGALPPVRFGGEMLIANSVHEEYQYLKVLGRPRSRQSAGKKNGVMVDRLMPGDGKEPKELVFDISRFYGEMGVLP